MFYSQRYRAIIQNSVDVHNFPFDNDILYVTVSPQYLTKTRLQFTVEQKVDVDAVDTQPEWHIQDVYGEAFVEGRSHFQARMVVHMYRLYDFYISRYLCVIFLMNLVSCTIIVLPHEDT
eukprot:UN14211